MNKQTLGKFDQNASLKKSIVVCLLAAALLVSVVGMASATTQTWSLHNTNYLHPPAQDGATPHALDKLMHKDTPCTNASHVEVTINSTHPAWWYDYVAQVNSTFGDNPWQAKIYHPVWTGEEAGNQTGETITGEVWLVWDNGTRIKKVASGSGGIKYGLPSTSLDIYDNGATTQEFSVGQRLAFRVCTNNATGLKIWYDGTSACSELESPWSDPGFPVPELPTIILMSTGLLALAGFVVYSRSRRRNGKAQ